jgi:hypothetical protein
MTFYELAIDKLRRYCQTLANGTEKKRAMEVCMHRVFYYRLCWFCLVSS